MRYLAAFAIIPLLVSCAEQETKDSSTAIQTETLVTSSTTEALAKDTSISEIDAILDYVGADEDTNLPSNVIEPLSSTVSVTPITNSRADLVAFTLVAKVIRISDGDTITIKDDAGAQFRIRMSDMDTPETAHDAFTPRDCQCKTIPYRPGQPGGEEASDALKSILSIDDDVRAECYESDRYGRLVCHIFKDGENVNLAMIENGWGWLPSRSAWVRDPQSSPAQDLARQAELGAWGIDGQISPEQWRRECWGNGNCAGSPTPQP